MIASITLVAILGINRTGGIATVLDRAIDGGRIFPPMYETLTYFQLAFYILLK